MRVEVLIELSADGVWWASTADESPASRRAQAVRVKKLRPIFVWHVASSSAFKMRRGLVHHRLLSLKPTS